MLDEQIRGLIEPLIKEHGFELWSCDVHRSGRHTLLRITVDGVTLDDCATLSREIGAILDVEDLIKTEYHLELSSPGLNRALLNMAHYARYVGSNVKLKLRPPHRKSGMAKIEKAEDDLITFAMDNEVITVSLSEIQKCELCY